MNLWDVKCLAIIVGTGFCAASVGAALWLLIKGDAALADCGE